MRKNIAIIITKLNGGGAERCASNLSVELAKIYNVYIVVFDAMDIAYPYGGTLVDLKIPKADGILSRYLGVIKRSYLLHKFKKDHNIDVSISLLEGPNLVNVLSRWKDKTIVSIRNHMSKQPSGIIAKKIIRYASKKSDITVALSKMVGRDLSENFGVNPTKIVTIYNHVDKNLLDKQDVKSKIELDPSKKYIITMGRLHPQKGHWHLIKAFKSVSELCPDLNLLLLGDGPLKYAIKKLIMDLNLEDRVIMPGYIEAPHKYLNDCEMFVLSSLYEGLGNVLLEAQAFGIPIISTDCKSGPREILSPDSDLSSNAEDVEYGRYGILVPVDDELEINAETELTFSEQKLVQAIVNLHNSPQLLEKYRKSSMEGSKRFNKEKIISDWRTLID